jgi:hypothetical protein
VGKIRTSLCDGYSSSYLEGKVSCGNPSLFFVAASRKKDPGRTLLNRIDQVKDEFQRSRGRFFYFVPGGMSLASRILQLLLIVVSYRVIPFSPCPEPRAGESEFGGSFPELQVWLKTLARYDSHAPAISVEVIAHAGSKLRLCALK